MPSVTCYITGSSKDRDQLSADTTQWLTWTRTVVGGVATVDTYAFADISTSAVTNILATGGTVTSATFTWKHKTADNTKAMRVAIWNGTDNNTTVYAGNGATANNSITTACTSSAVLNSLTSSGSQASLTFYLTFTSNVTRTSQIYSWDSGATYAPYVVVNYNDGTPAAATSRRRIFFIG